MSGHSREYKKLVNRNRVSLTDNLELMLIRYSMIYKLGKCLYSLNNIHKKIFYEQEAGDLLIGFYT